jgi:hypothetical protein
MYDATGENVCFERKAEVAVDFTSDLNMIQTLVYRSTRSRSSPAYPAGDGLTECKKLFID